MAAHSSKFGYPWATLSNMLQLCDCGPDQVFDMPGYFRAAFLQAPCGCTIADAAQAGTGGRYATEDRVPLAGRWGAAAGWDQQPCADVQQQTAVIETNWWPGKTGAVNPLPSPWCIWWKGFSKACGGKGVWVLMENGAQMSAFTLTLTVLFCL